MDCESELSNDMRARLMTKKEAEKQLKRDDLIVIKGLLRETLGIHVEGMVIKQGWFRIKMKPLKKFDKKRYKIFKNGELYKFPRFK